MERKCGTNSTNIYLLQSFHSHAIIENQRWMQFLSIMIISWNSCVLLDLSVGAVLALTFWTPTEFTEFFCPYLSEKQNALYADCFWLSSQLLGSWLFLSVLHSFHDTAVCLLIFPLLFGLYECSVRCECSGKSLICTSRQQRWHTPLQLYDRIIYRSRPKLKNKITANFNT
jgi:hypothetical protein